MYGVLEGAGGPGAATEPADHQALSLYSSQFSSLTVTAVCAGALSCRGQERRLMATAHTSRLLISFSDLSQFLTL